MLGVPVLSPVTTVQLRLTVLRLRSVSALISVTSKSPVSFLPTCTALLLRR